MANDPANDTASRERFLAALAASDPVAAGVEARSLLNGGATRQTKFISHALRGTRPANARAFRLALLSSFSIELAADAIAARAFAEGIFVDLYIAPFDQYRQEIINPASELYRFEPDAVVLAVEGDRWLPRIYHDYLGVGPTDGLKLVDTGISEITELVATFRQRSDAALLVHGFEPPSTRALGFIDGRIGLGQATLIDRANEQLQQLCQKAVGVYAVDYAGLIARVGIERWYDDRMRYYARAPIATPMLGELAREYIKYLRAITGQTKKCLVLDLDNTLWGGILGEQGPNGVALGSEYPGNAFLAFQRAVLDLRRRGTILAIASKNNPADVDELFEKNEAMVLKKEHFSAIEVGWGDKAGALTRIARTLNIGLEHMVFVDDNPAECALVEQTIPAVRVICLPSQPERYIDALLLDGLFDGLSISTEDLERGELYRRREQAETMRRDSGSLEGFYRDLAMTVTLAPVTQTSLARASQMTQKTNQFNTTTLRFNEAKLAARINDGNWWLTTIDVKDRFGSHGITGLLMSRLHQEHVEIETFLMSCRVIGRTVETAALARLAQRARAHGLKRVAGRIVPTSKNMPVRDLYEKHGFRRDPGDETLWWLDLDDAVPRDPEWLQIVETEAT